MNTDEVTRAEAQAFWAALDGRERQVLCDIDARERDSRLIRKLAEAGMLFWHDPAVGMRSNDSREGKTPATATGASAVHVPMIGLARELVLILDGCDQTNE